MGENPEKPWWNNTLSDIWAKLCHAERKWLKGTGQQEKARLKTGYVGIRKKLIERYSGQKDFTGILYNQN